MVQCKGAGPLYLLISLSFQVGLGRQCDLQWQHRRVQVYAGKFSLIQDPGRNEEAKGDGDDEVDLGDTCVGIFR